MHTLKKQQQGLPREESKGIALLYTILIGSIMLIVTLSIIALVVSEVRFSGRIDDATRAFYSAESGAEYALRWVLEGGVKEAEQDCVDLDDKSGFQREFDDGDVSWNDLEIQQITEGSNQFLRILSTGSFGEIKRNIVVDFTPRCIFVGEDAPGDPNDWDPPPPP